MHAIALWIAILALPTSVNASSSLNLEALAESIARNHPPSALEQSWLNKKLTVRLRLAENPPEQFTENGEPKGLSIDYVKLVCKGYQIDCQFIPFLGGSFSEALQKVGQPDGPDVLLTGRRTPERERLVLFTAEYLFTPSVILTRTNAPNIFSMDDLRGKKIVVEKGFVIAARLKELIPDIQFIEVVGTPKALETLAGGVGDAYVGNLTTSTFLTSKLGLTNLKIAAPTNFPIQGEAMMVRPDWPELVSLINKTIGALSIENKQAIQNRWYSLQFDGGAWKSYAIWTSLILGILAVLVAALVFWNKRLRAQRLELSAFLKEREELVSRLLKANKTAATGALSASIAHELNQPLGASNLNIQFLKMKLKKGELNPQLEGEVLAALETDNLRATNIIRSLRSIFMDSSIQTDRKNLEELISVVTTVTKPELSKWNIELFLDLQPKLYIAINEGEMQQVLLNLVNNAIEALHASQQSQRRIEICSRQEASMVKITIADNGPGIPNEDKELIFELLTSSKEAGMGLGLWLCKHIITRHGGSIQIEDTQGGGATFVISLPLVQALSGLQSAQNSNTSPQLNSG
jgi:signal transduction histidine kinase